MTMCYINSRFTLHNFSNCCDLYRDSVIHISSVSCYVLAVQKLVVVWSENSDEKNRIIAFCAIHRLLFLSRGSLLERGFKAGG